MFSSVNDNIPFFTMIHRSLVWVALVALVTISLPGFGGGDVSGPPVRQGIFDLSGREDVLATTSIALHGEWAFYWMQRLEPADFRKPSQPPVSAYVRLPGAWNGTMVDGREIGGAGYATYRLRILTRAIPADLALRIGTIASAYRLWVNGALVLENGSLGSNADSETNAQSSRVVGLPTGRPLELVLQVSNYHYREGGVLSAIELGTRDRLESARLGKWAVVSFCIGAITVMGLSHLVLYALRRRNVATLYFGIYCLLWTSYLLTSDSGDWVVGMLMLSIPEQLLNRVDLLSFVLSVPVLHAFFRALYADAFSRRLGQAAWVMAALFTLLGVSLPTLAFTSLIPAYYLFSIVMILYFLARLIVATRRRLEGALPILAGFIVLGGTGINDMLIDLQLIESVFSMHVGLLAFVLSQSFALSLRFSKAFTAVERLSAELADKNFSLAVERDASDHLAREVVNVSEDERRRISHELHDGLCQQLTGTRLHFSVLRRKLAGAAEQDPNLAEELGQLASMLGDMVDQAYDLSYGLWPVDHDNRDASPSLAELAHRLSMTSGIAINLVEQRGCEICRNVGATQLYRIAQEAITNAVRHAKPNRIVVNFDCADGRTMSLTVRDDGTGRQGAARSEGGLGIRIMAHRARILGGNLEIADSPGGGTLVRCTAPCKARAEQEPSP